MGSSERAVAERVDGALEALRRSIASYAPFKEHGSLDSSASSSRPDVRAVIEEVEEIHKLLADEPYSLGLRLLLTDNYYFLDYPDLAAGEAYKMLLLIDEVLDESGEYHEEALDATKKVVTLQSGKERWTEVQSHCQTDLGLEKYKHVREPIDIDVGDVEAQVWAEHYFSKHAYKYLTLSLLICGCLKPAYEFCTRGLEKHPDDTTRIISNRVDKDVRAFLESSGTSSENNEIDIESLPDKCYTRRELYPWNKHEPDRFSHESLHLLNEQMSRVAPKLEVCATELPVLSQESSSATGSATVKQLGVFAKSDIQPGETILEERSLLTANSRLHDAFCDACSLALPNVRSAKASSVELEAASRIVHCPECDDTVFCSQECMDLAGFSYHAAVCSTDVEAVAKDAPPAEAADALYSLLLLRAIAMAETQDVHPLDLPEVKYIWGDYQDAPVNWLNNDRGDGIFERMLRTLPFSFKYNVLLPLHMLEKIDVNIFTTQRYDTWVLNTLYAKFRGTASARQGLDGRPEVGAVHPMWCLANHSCDPNVSWEWGGSIRFWARKERVLWKGKKERKRAGLNKGEEIFNHYCDIELPVKERREWAAGALGGLCMCERCVWEDAYEKKGTQEKARAP